MFYRLGGGGGIEDDLNTEFFYKKKKHQFKYFDRVSYYDFKCLWQIVVKNPE